MSQHDNEFGLILNQTVAIKRRGGFTVTAMGDRKSTGESIVGDATSVYFHALNGWQIRNLPGDFADVRYRMFAKLGTNVQPGDTMSPMYNVNGLTVGIIKDVQLIVDFEGLTHHIECLVTRGS